MSEIIYMSPELLEVIRRHRLDDIDVAFNFGSAHDLTRPGLGHRKYLRLTLDDASGKIHTLYLKRYDREPLSWRLRRLFTYGPRESPASVELECVRGANNANLPAIRWAYCNQEVDIWGAKRSYTILSEVRGAALEHCLEGFLSRSAGNQKVLEVFVDRLASLTASLHKSGFVHRDLYTSHIYLLEENGDFGLWLIDLARMFKPRWRQFRWRVKDISQLKYSMPLEWTAAWWDRFMEKYLCELGVKCGRRFRLAVDVKEKLMRWKLDRRPVANK